MKGKYEVEIWNNRLKYHLVLERNITIIKRNSGTGKSCLYRMASELMDEQYGKVSGVRCNCKDKLMVLDVRSDWKSLINGNKNKIFIIDEYIPYVDTQEFASIAQASGNYFIIITRSNRLKWLTYSVNSIFELSSEKKGNVCTTRLSSKFENTLECIKPGVVVVEDSNSGKEM